MNNTVPHTMSLSYTNASLLFRCEHSFDFCCPPLASREELLQPTKPVHHLDDCFRCRTGARNKGSTYQVYLDALCAPCSGASDYHHLTCGHLVHSPGMANCRSNCGPKMHVVIGLSDFLCPTCVQYYFEDSRRERLQEWHDASEEIDALSLGYNTARLELWGDVQVREPEELVPPVDGDFAARLLSTWRLCEPVDIKELDVEHAMEKMHIGERERTLEDLQVRIGNLEIDNAECFQRAFGEGCGEESIRGSCPQP